MEECLQKKTGVTASMVLSKNNTASGNKIVTTGWCFWEPHPSNVVVSTIEIFQSGLAKKRKVLSKVHFCLAYSVNS